MRLRRGASTSGATFDAVVLASHFVNDADLEARRRVLETCARHVAPSGAVLVQSYPPDLDWKASAGVTRFLGDVAVTVREATVEGGTIHAVVEYVVDGRSWRQPFTARMLDSDGLDAALHEVDLRLARWLDERRTWSEARLCENRVR